MDTENRQEEISVLDVKALYDAAYELKSNEPEKAERFKALMAEAVRMDLAYRQQLAKTAPKYKNSTPAQTEEKDSRVA